MKNYEFKSGNKVLFWNSNYRNGVPNISSGIIIHLTSSELDIAYVNSNGQLRCVFKRALYKDNRIGRKLIVKYMLDHLKGLLNE